MKTSPEFRGARLVLVGAPGSGSVDLLRAVTDRFGLEPPEPLAAGRWELIRSDVTVGSTHLELVSLEKVGPYAGVRDLLMKSADGVLVVFDVSPPRIAESRRIFDRLRPGLEEDGRPYGVQYHRTERELRFDAARMDAWLGLAGDEIPRVSTTSDAPEQPFERLVSGLFSGSPEG